jgi:hypothetical protein
MPGNWSGAGLKVIRPFGLHDIMLVRRLQRNGMSLAVEHMLSHPHQPLWTALTAPWPWAGVGVATYVLDEPHCDQRLTGFVQMMKRAARPEADLLHLAPAASVDDGDAAEVEFLGRAIPPCDSYGALVWSRLLSHCMSAAAGHGLQRVFASTPDGCAEQACLREAAFSPYTRETIYRLASAPPASGSLVGFRPQTPQDSWALQRLYTRSTPRLVQQAEGALTGEVGSPPLSWWEPDSWQGIVWEPAGEVRGAVQIHRGRAGHWLRIWGANEVSARELRSLIEQGLRRLDLLERPRRTVPVYTTVREYENGLSGALTGFGFAPYMGRVRFVKHTVAMVRQAAPAAVVGRDVRQEIPVRSEPHRT